MLNKKTLKSLLTFTENQHTAPNFIIIYLITWLVWHNQLLTHFMNTEGDFFTKLSAGFASINDNQYVVVFLLTCLIFLIRIGFAYLSYRSRELLNSTDDELVSVREDQKFAQNSDIANLMTALEKTKEQLAESKAREKQAITEKTEALTKILALQNQLDEAKADIEILNNEHLS